MPMNIRVFETNIAGLQIIDLDLFQDERGFFFESYSKQRFEENGFNIDFVQDNHSRSLKGVVRGFHFQDSTAPQWRLVRCTVGQVWDVVVDLRISSSTFGKWFGLELTAENKQQLLIPPEFAHGFCVLSDIAEVQYKCSNFHSAEAERTLAWDDADVAVPWPIENPVLSQRDREAGDTLQSYREKPLFS